ncbi:nephrocystin-3-like [Argopecten irradians]|uniref:nephrocystin-3-like n=1 Tax=Argopecten irradians TaxID=31199 RepID=UPI0037244283
MGTGGSFLRNNEDDDILGTDLDGSSHGVIKRIPIEMKPRGKLGLRSGASKKPKGGSLRSALSIDLENPEAEKIRKDFEMYRLNKENDIANMQRKEQRLTIENKRLRAELLVLQKTCANLRTERDGALDAEQQALARSGAFEQDRDKVQRQFKIFRENQEYEIQNLLRAKRELENKLSKLTHGYADDADTASNSDFMEPAMGNPGDWWTALESEPSLGSTIQLHQPTIKGPEFAHSMMDTDGPFTNVNREDWSSVLANLTQMVPVIPEHSLSPVLRVYISAPRDSHAEVEILNKEYMPKLSSICEAEGRCLALVHLVFDENNPPSTQIDLHMSTRQKQIAKSSIFLAFLGEATDRFTSMEYKHGFFDNPTWRSSVFCFRESKGSRTSQSEAKELKAKVREMGCAKVVDGYIVPSRGVEQASAELEKILKGELGVGNKLEKQEEEDNGLIEGEGPEQLCGGAIFDIHGDLEQMEAINFAKRSSCELGFEKHYERLNGHVLSAGPLPPLLMTGSSGTGRSLLLAKWIQLQQEKVPSSLVLYHFVGSNSSVSADAVNMIRRLTAQLMQQVNSPPALTCDPGRLVEEFPRWLEKVSAKTVGGVILVMDSIDRFQQAEVHLKWLLDPLPVDTRVIVSVTDETCPQAWRSWPTLQVEPLSNKNVKELIHAELAIQNTQISQEEETLILTHCRTAPTCCPLYVMVLARHIASYAKNEGKVGRHLDVMLTCPDCVSLYSKVLDLVRVSLESHDTRGFLKTILRYIYVSRSGLNEIELLYLVQGLTWNFLALFTEVLVDLLVLKFQGGLLSFAHEQVEKAVQDYCFGKEEGKLVPQLRQDLIQYFIQFQSPGKFTCRVSDELPWLIRQTGDKDSLEKCILNLCLFQRFYARGRCAELISYWQFIASDKNSMAQAYFQATRSMEATVGQHNGLVTLPRIADMYESQGRFLKDLGLLSQAVPALQRALEVREIALDPDHPIVARSQHQLAGLHAQWGKFSTAEDFYKQALTMYENAYGSDHHLVAKELDALAVLYQKQDKHDLAEPLKKRAMSIRKKAKTPRSHSGQVKSVVQRRALQLEELAIGPDSPDLARTLNELGVLYYLQNNLETAESFFKRSLEMREVTLGPDHLDVAQSLNNLAALYNDRKQYDKAAPLYERALQIRSKYLSINHDSVATIVKHLATLYRKQGKYEQAEPLYKQAIEIREKSFGAYHPSVATALVNLAVLYSQQNKYAEAEPLYERALKIYEESLGAHHPRVAETLRNLAVMKYEQKDFETAAKLYKRATEMKDSDVPYGGKVLSRRSSSVDTSSTVKNLLQT